MLVPNVGILLNLFQEQLKILNFQPSVSKVCILFIAFFMQFPVLCFELGSWGSWAFIWLKDNRWKIWETNMHGTITINTCVTVYFDHIAVFEAPYCWTSVTVTGYSLYIYVCMWSDWMFCNLWLVNILLSISSVVPKAFFLTFQGVNIKKLDW